MSGRWVRAADGVYLRDPVEISIGDIYSTVNHDVRDVTTKNRYGYGGAVSAQVGVAGIV